MSYTKGPWEMRLNMNQSFVLLGEGTVIADGIRLMNQTANAKLIAAAPELLEALKLSLLLVEMSSSYRSVDIAEKARAAINKAFDNG